MQNQDKNPLHGITLQTILEKLVEYYGFDTLGELIPIKCFTSNPSIKSSLTFLRKTDWARKKVEDLYIKSIPKFPV
ncbi:VF530 family DNA-binding protein [Flavobacterium sp. AJR]|uniref:VF530 family protein n=1 Tax=Flavobacterium sp. AJR TaxID=1979369 RepID=UPI000A3D7203|nr:VF530 family protein [Flavobacterium sp. AJR]OUL60286.1 transporter [Flavobacterium sp. AJR]